MKRLAMVCHRVPYPPDKGERVRAYHQLRALARHFRITLATLTHDAPDRKAADTLGQWCDEVITAGAGGLAGRVRGGLRLLAGRSVTEGYFHSPRLLQQLLASASGDPFDLVFAYSSGVMPVALGVPAPVRIMDLVDVDSAKWSSYADAAHWPMRWVYRREARGVARLERQALERFDAVTLVSKAEVAALGTPSDKLLAVGNGVDTEYFSPPETPGDRPSLVFTGTMDYRPNVEGVLWFVRDIWPELKRRRPDLEFTIVGRNPTLAVDRLADVPGVIVTGGVPDVRPYLSHAAVAVVPLRVARGVQNKVLEAMAMGRAVVGTSQALEGLDVVPGEHVLQADTAPQWHRTLSELLDQDDRRRQLGAAARQHVVQEYSWEAQLAPLVDLCLRLTEGQPSATA
jgi:sugar transferase (PEP-CTERM/EpsH1 system associated)